MEDFPTSVDLLGKSASAYEHLRRSVVRGQLRPGRRLTATDLAGVFRISVTPVREALVRMAAEGLIAWEASHGYFTKPFTVTEQMDLHEMLSLGLAPGLGRAGPQPRALFEAVAGEVAEFGAGETLEAYVDRIESLARAIVALSANQVLVGVMTLVLDRTHLVRRLDLAVPDRFEATALRIRDLASAVLAEDGRTALSLLDDHLTARRARLPELVEQANALAQASRYP